MQKVAVKAGCVDKEVIITDWSDAATTLGTWELQQDRR
jgi:hypothetical protein